MAVNGCSKTIFSYMDFIKEILSAKNMKFFKGIFQLCTNSVVARIFPGVPFYFDPVGH